MQLLSGAMRSYPWGSHTAIAELRGHASPSDSPEAELWYGAHPGDPSTLHVSDRRTLSPLTRQLLQTLSTILELGCVENLATPCRSS